MIQRIQSVWLLLAAAAAFCSLQFSFYSGYLIADQVKSLVSITAQSNLLLLILTAGVGLACFFAVFMFKNRKLQLRILTATLIISIVNLVLSFLQTQKFVPGQSNYNLGAVFPFLVPILIIMAIRGVRRDERLVKSLDRLR
jgi:ABC-type uncharacterized transport system permease subunit